MYVGIRRYNWGGEEKGCQTRYNGVTFWSHVGIGTHFALATHWPTVVQRYWR